MNINDIVTNIQFSQRSLIGLCLSIAVIVVITFFYTSWQWYNDWVLAHQTTAAASVVAKTNEMAELISAIPDEHLFGKSFPKTNEMPITNLQLRVTGIVKVNSEKYGSFSKAYISISGQPSKIYEVGDSLPYGVKVHEITSNTVILENNGQLEKLPLPREPLKFKPRQIEESK